MAKEELSLTMVHNKTKASRHACNRCRTSKVRCFHDTIKQHGKCRRCYEENEECVLDNIAPRQRRARTDSRLKNLEQEIKALRAELKDIQQERNALSDLPSRNEPCCLCSNIPGQVSPRKAIPFNKSKASVTDYLFADEAERMYNMFITKTLPQYPILLISCEWGFEAIRFAQPLLAFAMVTAATRAYNPVLFSQFHNHLSRVLAEKIFVNAEKSVELLQSLLIAETWYDPPDDLRQLNFYMWLQTAAIMAQRLGLWWDGDLLSVITHNQASAEQLVRWRSAISAYLAISTVSISLQNPQPYQMPVAARKALAKFTLNVDNINDKRLAAWMTLQLIAEEVEALRLKLISYEKSTECNIQNTLSDLESRLDLYRETNILNETLRVHYFYVSGKLKELEVLYCDIITVLPASALANPYLILPGKQLQAIVYLISASHNVLDAVLRIPLQLYLHTPTVTTVRALYAVNTLLLLRKNAGHLISEASTSDVTSLLEFKNYLQRFEDYLVRAKGSDNHRVPSMGLTAIKNIRRKAADMKVQTNSVHLRYKNLTETNKLFDRPDNLINDLEIVTASTLPIRSRLILMAT